MRKHEGRRCHNSPLCFSFLFLFPFSYPSSYGLILPFSCCVYISSTPVPIVTSFADASSSIYCSSLLDLSPFLMDSQGFLLSPFIHTLPHCIRNACPHVCAYIGCNIPRGEAKLILLRTPLTPAAHL